MTTKKIPAEVLMRFCAKDDLNESLNHPILMMGLILASNRDIAIRVDQDATELVDGVLEHQKISQKIWTLIKNTKAKRKPLIPLPTLPSPVPCEYCNGTGKIQGRDDSGACRACMGFGEHPYRYTKAGPGAYIANRYLRLISELPNPQIATDWLSVCYFTFDGGDGVVMPMRVTENDEAQP